MLEECLKCTPNSFDGILIAAFGLGRYFWEGGDRELAAEYYGFGVKGGQDAEAQGVSLSGYAQDSLRGCRDNLRAMQGVPLPNPVGGISAKLFFRASPAPPGTPLPAPNLKCCAPGCSQDPAVDMCSGCFKVRYCNRECQKKAWPTHKEACKKTRAEAAAAGITLKHPGVDRG